MSELKPDAPTELTKHDKPPNGRDVVLPDWFFGALAIELPDVDEAAYKRVRELCRDAIQQSIDANGDEN